MPWLCKCCWVQGAQCLYQLGTVFVGWILAKVVVWVLFCFLRFSVKFFSFCFSPSFFPSWCFLTAEVNLTETVGIGPITCNMGPTGCDRNPWAPVGCAQPTKVSQTAGGVFCWLSLFLGLTTLLGQGLVCEVTTLSRANQQDPILLGIETRMYTPAPKGVSSVRTSLRHCWEGNSGFQSVQGWDLTSRGQRNQGSYRYYLASSILKMSFEIENKRESWDCCLGEKAVKRNSSLLPAPVFSLLRCCVHS